MKLSKGTRLIVALTVAWLVIGGLALLILSAYMYPTDVVLPAAYQIGQAPKWPAIALKALFLFVPLAALWAVFFAALGLAVAHPGAMPNNLFSRSRFAARLNSGAVP